MAQRRALPPEGPQSACTFQSLWLEPREHRERGRGRPEEPRGSVGQGLAGHWKDFGFSPRATGSHRSVLSSSLSFS